MADLSDAAKTAIQELAQKAEVKSPSPWTVDADRSKGVAGSNILTGFGRVFDAKATDYREICDYIDIETCEFVAACDPQTILSLLQRLDAAEQALATRTQERDSLRLELQASGHNRLAGNAELIQQRDVLLAKVRALPSPILTLPPEACWNCKGHGVLNEALGANDAIVWVPPYPCPCCNGTGLEVNAGSCHEIRVQPTVCYMTFGPGVSTRNRHTKDLELRTVRDDMLIADLDDHDRIIGIELVGNDKPCQWPKPKPDEGRHDPARAARPATPTE